MKRSYDCKWIKVPNDCLSCALSFSVDDSNGNMKLIWGKDKNHHVNRYECLIKEVSELYPNPKYGDYIIYKGYQFAFDGTEWVIVQ